jgi:hypothetical protein
MATPTKRHSLPPRSLHLTTSNLDSLSRTSSSSDVVPPLSTTPSRQKRPAAKRQQSISYLPHNSDPRWTIRSPTAAASPSISSEGRDSPALLAPQRESAPLTLAEKCVYHLCTRPLQVPNQSRHQTRRLTYIHRPEGSQMHGTSHTACLPGGRAYAAETKVGKDREPRLRPSVRRQWHNTPAECFRPSA